MIPYFTLSEVWIWGLRLNVWGLMVGLGLIVSLFLIRHRAKRMSLSSRQAFDVGLWVFLGAVIGGRLGFVALYEPAYFAANPGELYAFWGGGMSAIGGVLGAIVVFFLATNARLVKPLRMRLADVLAYAWPFGWAVGRLGCFFIHDHPGIATNFFLAVRFPDGARLDMGLLESLGAVMIALMAYFLSRRQILRGVMTAAVAIAYGLMRFALDFLRPWVGNGAETRWSGLTPAQYGSLILIAIGIILWLRRGTPADADRHGAGVV